MKTTKMGNLDVKADKEVSKSDGALRRAKKSRKGAKSLAQVKSEIDAKNPTYVSPLTGGKLPGKAPKIDTAKLFKVLGDDIQETNKSLLDIGNILRADFAARIDAEKAEIAMLQQESSKEKIKAEERGLEKKNLGSKIKDQAAKGMAPVKSMMDKFIEMATLLLAGFAGNAIFEFLKTDAFKNAWRGFTKFIIKGSMWLAKTVAAVIGFFSIKNLFKLFKKGIKFLLDIPKKLLNFAKNLFKLPKRLKAVFKGIGGKLKNIGAKGAEVFATIGNIIKKVKNFLKGGVGKVLGFGKKLFKGGKTLMKSGVKGLKTAGKGLGKTVGKSLGKGAGKSVLKKIPFVGLGLGAAFAVDRLRKGDWGGALMEIGSGAASMIPGVGTAVSTAIDVGLIAKDIGDAKAEQEQGEVVAAKVGKRVTKGTRVLVGETGPEMLEMPFTGTVKHATETLNTLKDDAGQGGVEIINVPTTPIMAKPPEVAQEADIPANPSEFISSMNKLNDYMNTTPDVLGMTV